MLKKIIQAIRQLFKRKNKIDYVELYRGLDELYKQKPYLDPSNEMFDWERSEQEKIKFIQTHKI